MEFIESAIFTRQIRMAMTDAEYSVMQEFLVARPTAGALIPGGGGIRKLRWSGSGHGKSGGFRVIYYLAVTKDCIVFFYMYRKNETADLTPAQIATLKKLIKGK